MEQVAPSNDMNEARSIGSRWSSGGEALQTSLISCALIKGCRNYITLSLNCRLLSLVPNIEFVADEATTILCTVCHIQSSVSKSVSVLYYVAKRTANILQLRRDERRPVDRT